MATVGESIPGHEKSPLSDQGSVLRLFCEDAGDELTASDEDLASSLVSW